MSAPKQGQYGEEWSVERQGDKRGYRVIGGVSGYEIALDIQEHDAERIVSCVNALDGRVPEKLRAVIEAASLLLIDSSERAHVRLEAALRDFGEEV